MFRHFDGDGDGMITKGDLKRILSREYGGVEEERLDAMIDYMIQEVDIDEDGRINFEEFVTIMMAL